MVIKSSTNPTGADHAKKKRKQIFVYGNYKAYYGYRVPPAPYSAFLNFSSPSFGGLNLFFFACLYWQIGRDASDDPRLSMFKKEWFEGKDCLDIGCNQGIVTIDVG